MSRERARSAELLQAEPTKRPRSWYQHHQLIGRIVVAHLRRAVSLPPTLSTRRRNLSASPAKPPRNPRTAPPPHTMMNSNAADAAAAVGISPFMITSKPPDVLVNSWKETRQARAELDQCQREKAFLETQLSDEQDRNGRLERENSALEEDNATLRARLAAFEVENPLPPGWERIFSNTHQRFFYSHATTEHTQWHYPTESEVRDPAIAKMRADHNRRLS